MRFPRNLTCEVSTSSVVAVLVSLCCCCCCCETVRVFGECRKDEETGEGTNVWQKERQCLSLFFGRITSQDADKQEKGGRRFEEAMLVFVFVFDDVLWSEEGLSLPLVRARVCVRAAGAGRGVRGKGGRG